MVSGRAERGRNFLSKNAPRFYRKFWALMLWIRKSGSEKGSSGKGVFQKKVDFLEILEDLEILESPQTVENKEESNHLLEIPENLGILVEIPPVKRPLS